ncbi:metallophosphoesterase family protein [Nocardioides iriomotensis]|uniref:Metallophosphatase family protein n=1 Tax=Nocardioides iriomotensis TaxID=715784 RepID=A0A4Q5J9W8_9ACTN|nr:metallophosphoesterase family protein [Nocardioides iriomotensis]RYU14788.1 metallophosphatase family protein [Nocardioides iriomotensis]
MTSTRALLAGLGAVTLVSAPLAAAPSSAAPGQDQPTRTSFAVIGDVPYGAAQIAAFPGWIDRINAEPGLDLTVHVGDIKNGSSPCTDEYNAMIREQFERIQMPLLYTPGDNEWTDCHRPAAGTYDPLERLDAVRNTFFAMPGRTLGADPIKVDSQADLGFPENQSLRVRGVEMATLHVVGSNNDRAPWTGLGFTAPTTEQLAEERDRMTATLDLVADTFTRARQTNARAVAIFQQADMFDPSYQPAWDVSAFRPLVQKLIDEASTFEGEIYLFDGDSHVYNVDRPVSAGSRWLDIYDVDGSADNLTRVTVDGEANNTNFLEVTVSRPGAPSVLSWRRVAYDS